MFDGKLYDLMTSCTVVGGALGGAGAAYQAGYQSLDMSMLKGAAFGALVAYLAHELDRQLSANGTMTSMWPTDQTMCYAAGGVIGFAGSYWAYRNATFLG
jgi:hypothetical protein